MGWLYSPWDLYPFLPLHLLTTLSLPSPSTLLPLQDTHKWARYSPIGLTFRVVDDANTRLAEFETPLKSNSDFDFDIAFSTGFLKLSKYLYVLITYTKTFPLFYFGLLQSVSLTIWPFHFRVADISCYIKIPRRFWNSVNGDYKTHSHNK
jgi:hypothetical protein